MRPVYNRWGWSGTSVWHSGEICQSLKISVSDCSAILSRALNWRGM